MSYQDMFKPAPKFFPMPNTGTILDITAGFWVKGTKDQNILNGGVALFYGIGALPNMFKSTIAAGMGGAVLRAFPDGIAHAHDTETTMVQDRVEYLMRQSMELGGDFKRPENLESCGRLFFTTSVDYDGTELFSNLKEFCKKRLKEEEQIELEILDPQTNKPYKYFKPIFEFWDSLSGLKTKDAEEKQSEADVGTKETNMLAMNFNKGKSDIVEQAPNLTAKHGIYLCFTAHVGQKYELDPRKPGVKTLRWLKGDVKLKRVPENTTFNTGNFYVVSAMSQLVAEGGVDFFPYTAEMKAQKSPDLIELTLVNQRGKFGYSNNPLPIVVSQKHGWQPALSNLVFLRQEGKYGIIGNDQNYALALTPDVKMRRTTAWTIFRENLKVTRAALILAEMRYMFTRDLEKYETYFCTPDELYTDIKNLGYDWDLLLNTRFWFTQLNPKVAEELNPLTTLDILKMRVGEYHPYWYPIAKKDMKPIKVENHEKAST